MRAITIAGISLLLCLLMFTINAQANDELIDIKIGDRNITAILDANTSMEASLLPDLAKYPQFSGVFKNGPLPSVSRTYLLEIPNHVILFDAGWGEGQKIKGDTIKLLNEKGIRPEAVTDILLTHLDSDHIGGLISGDKAAFPNAVIHVSAPEWEAWQNGAVQKRSHEAIARAQSLREIYKNKIRLFNFGDEILPGITAISAVGHTPGHTVYDIVSGNDKLTIAGDLIHIPQIQLIKPEMSTVYDMDMNKAAQTRKEILQKAARDKSQFAGMHFPAISDVRERDDGGFIMKEPR